MVQSNVLRGFWAGGFECSTQRHPDGTRLDLIAATQHDRFAAQDYAALRDCGLHTARDGVRWHLVERSAGQYDFASFMPMLQAAHATGMQVIWDLCHYGYPDDLDIWRPEFVRRFAGYASAIARTIADQTDAVPFYCPINEISFWAWAGGDVAYMNPHAHGRGFELKAQLVRAAIAAMDAIWAVDPRARFVHAEPLINIVADPSRPHEHHAAEMYCGFQYQAWDMLAGHLWPQIGGDPRYLDIIGVNYYHDNQWIHNGPHIDFTHPQYKPLRTMLQEVNDRYQRPLIIAETGRVHVQRPAWLRYIGAEARAALRAGVALHGICWYPILNRPAWDDPLHIHEDGLFEQADARGNRRVYAPLLDELRHQQYLFAQPEQPEAQREAGA